MIVVIADDLSGAAELAGAALQGGLTAEVQSVFTSKADADVICVDTDTRSLPRDEAARVVGGVARAIAAARPAWIYKKCDSVLRGNVLAEIQAIVEATGKNEAILISANPSRGRVIRGGKYFIDGRPLSETPFAQDPEYPRGTSTISELLGGESADVQTPDAECTADLDRYATGLSLSVLPAGGVEFFEALLRARTAMGRPSGEGTRGNFVSPVATLFVCGSATAWARGRSAQAAAHGVVVLSMPAELFRTGIDRAVMENWIDSIVTALHDGRSVMAAIGRTDLVNEIPPAQLAERLATAVARVVMRQPVKRICAEGGASAAAVARALNWTRFTVERQLAGGVVELRPHAGREHEFIIKVGSYDWPEAIWPGPPR